MDWQKILTNIKNFFKKLGEIIVYYAPIIAQKIWQGLKIAFAFIKKLVKKLIKATKKYIRLTVKRTKQGDYSMLICTGVILVAVILVFVLLGNAIKGHKKNKKEKTTTEITTEMTTTEDPAIALQNQLKEQALQIYNNNQALLILVNSTHPLPEGYSFEHHTLNCGKDVDVRCLEDLRAMLNDCNVAGFEYNIVSAYRDKTSQQRILDEEISRLKSEQGLSDEEAKAKALETVQAPGYSEHETGLSLDLTSLSAITLDDYVAEDGTNQWLMNNCYNYGFVLRYPADKSAITGIAYEPWHFRYVGKDAAAFMRDNNLTLEEFYQLIGM